MGASVQLSPRPGAEIEVGPSAYPLIWIHIGADDLWLHFDSHKETMLALHQLRYQIDKEIARRTKGENDGNEG